MNVAVLGASAKPDRYSYKAIKLLEQKGHRVFPVHPLIPNIDELTVFKSLTDIWEPINTVTIYLSPENSNKVAQELLKSPVKRVIFNPGAENAALAAQLAAKNIEVVNGCTLVMLTTGQF